MGKKISFGLEMKDGEPPVRDIDALRKNFDIEKAMGYFKSGKLVEWLENRFCDEEAEKVNAIDKTAPTDVIQRQLCEALGVDVSEVKVDESLDMEIVQRNNEKKDILRQKTSDQSIISHAAQTAFNQGDLADLLNMDEPTIYLCGDCFKIRSRMTNRAYIGVLGTPKIEIDAKNREELAEKGIKFENVELLEYLREKEPEETKPCPKCGHENPATAKFCNECGASMTGRETSASPSNDKVWKIPKTQLKIMFVATFKPEYELFEIDSVSKIDKNATFLMKLDGYHNMSDDFSEEQKDTALTLICAGKYTEDDLIHLRISEDMSCGWALTLNSFCFVDRYTGISSIILYEKLEIQGYEMDAKIKLSGNQDIRTCDMLGGFETGVPLGKYLTNMRNMFQNKV